jgi:hypothetical protein
VNPEDHHGPPELWEMLVGIVLGVALLGALITMFVNWK